MKITIEKAKAKLKEMVKFDEENEVKYLYQNSKEFMYAREYLRLQLQQIINQ